MRSGYKIITGACPPRALEGLPASCFGGLARLVLWRACPPRALEGLPASGGIVRLGRVYPPSVGRLVRLGRFKWGFETTSEKSP
jgi:hypothetical protein